MSADEPTMRERLRDDILLFHGEPATDADRCVADMLAAQFIAAGWAQRAAVIEECAKVADAYGDTKPNLDASSNPTLAKTMATVMSHTGERIATSIRALAQPKAAA